MSQLTLNINKSTHEALLKLAESSGEPVQVVLDKAIENYRRTLFLVEANVAFEKLKINKDLWSEEISERLAWDQTIDDGVED